MSVRLSFIGKTDCPISTRDMIKEGFEIPEDKYIVEFWDVQSEDYLTKPVLTNQQIETIIKRLKGTHKEDRILFLLFTGVILLLSINCYAPNNNTKKQYPKHPIDTCDIQLNDSCILKELNRIGCYFPEVAIRQIHQECGININSKIAKENKNIFGIKCSCKLTHGVKNGHSNYKTYRDNIQCYVNFSNKYWEKWCRNYAEDELYLNHLIKIK